MVREALDMRPDDTRAIEELMQEWRFVRRDYWSDLPRDEEEGRYDLRHPPTQRFSVVYVPSAEGTA